MGQQKSDDGRLKRLLILSLIRKHFAEHGYPPQLADLSRETSIPRTTLRWHLDSLREQGYLRYDGSAITRSMKVTKKDEAAVR